MGGKTTKEHRVWLLHLRTYKLELCIQGRIDSLGRVWNACCIQVILQRKRKGREGKVGDW